MQALEKIGVLEKDEEKGGRRITQSGQRDLGKSYFASFLDGSQSIKMPLGLGLFWRTLVLGCSIPLKLPILQCLGICNANS
jgi:hypothetical protein